MQFIVKLEADRGRSMNGSYKLKFIGAGIPCKKEQNDL